MSEAPVNEDQVRPEEKGPQQAYTPDSTEGEKSHDGVSRSEEKWQQQADTPGSTEREKSQDGVSGVPSSSTSLNLATGRTVTSEGPPELGDNFEDDVHDVIHPLDMPVWKEIIFLFMIIMAQVFTQAMVGQVLIPLHVIGQHFNVKNDGELSWLIAAYSLTVGTFILSAGRLGDMYGHKLMFMFGIGWMTLWSLLAGISGYASSSTFFTVCRAFQGIGPAFMLPAALAILGATYPPGRKKNLVFALFGASAPTGFNLGAVFSGLVSQFSDWEWAFYLNTIVGAVYLVIVLWVVPKDRDLRQDESFDLLGAITGVSGLVLFNFAWNQAPLVGWQDPYIYVLLIVGVLLLVAFFYVESRVAAHPLVPIKAISSSVIVVLTCLGLGWATFGIWVYYTMQMIQILRGHTLMSSVAQSIPVSLSGLTAALFTGFLFNVRAPKNLVMLLALTGFTVSAILLATTPIDQTYWAQTFVGFIIAPFGMDMSFPAATLLLSDAVPRRHQGIAASLVATVVNYSISMGLGFAGTVITYVSPGDSQQEFLKGLRSAAYLGIGMSGLGMLLAGAGLIRELSKGKRGVQTAV
jgi:MFS family permease